MSTGEVPSSDAIASPSFRRFKEFQEIYQVYRDGDSYPKLRQKMLIEPRLFGLTYADTRRLQYRAAPKYLAMLMDGEMVIKDQQGNSQPSNGELFTVQNAQDLFTQYRQQAKLHGATSPQNTQ